MKCSQSCATMLVALICLSPMSLRALEDDPISASDEPLSVDLFEAMDIGQVEVTVIAHSYAQVSLRVRNKTKRELVLQMPDVFAAVPVPPQPRNQRSLSDPRQGILGQGTSQGVGGSLADIGGLAPEQVAEMAAKGKGGILTLAPGKLVTEKVDSFCLEFGKADPNRRITYRLVPLEQFNDKSALRELLREFGAGQHPQRVAQLAVWHVANGVPFEKLAHLRMSRAPGGGRRTFSEDEVKAAQTLVTSLPSYQQPSLGDASGA